MDGFLESLRRIQDAFARLNMQEAEHTHTHTHTHARTHSTSFEISNDSDKALGQHHFVSSAASSCLLVQVSLEVALRLQALKWIRAIIEQPVH